MAASYLDTYGSALRRLQALEMGMDPNAPEGPSGPQPVTGAFQLQGPPSNLNPRYAPDPAMPAFQQAQPAAPGAIQAPAGPQPPAAAGPAPAEGGAVQQSPQGVRDIVAGLAKDERKELRAGIKQHTGKSVDELYEQMVQGGELAPDIKRKPRAAEKLSVVAEALFRYMSKAFNGMNPGAAAAEATLETQGRRGAIAQADVEAENARAEGRRGEVQGVLNSRAARAQGKADKAEERGWEAEKMRVEARDRGALQSQQDKAAMARTQVEAASRQSTMDKAPKTMTGDDGTVFERGEDGVYRPAVTETEVDENLPRGKKIKSKKRGVLKTTTKAQTGALTQASRAKMYSDAVKTIQGDVRTMSEIRRAAGGEASAIADEIDRRAKDMVENAASAAENGDGEYGQNPLD